MSDTGTLKQLKEDYERLRDQYLHHFLKFQKAFRAYMTFIDSHNISLPMIEALDLSMEDFMGETAEREDHHLPQDGVFSKRQTRRTVPQRKKQILAFLDRHEGFLSTPDLTSVLSMEETRIRSLMNFLVEDGLVERAVIKQKYYWRKKPS
jgi:hypothetical protein